MNTLEPFEALLRNEGHMKVKDIMRSSNRSISKEASILEAALLITTKGYRHIPVVEKGIVVGMVSETDILKKVIRGQMWHS
jgi:predicted transcriptional regulator